MKTDSYIIKMIQQELEAFENGNDKLVKKSILNRINRFIDDLCKTIEV